MKLNFMENPDHILVTKTLNFQMSNFNVFFQMVLVYYGITLRHLREQLLLQNHKTQRHTVYIKIPELSWMKNCSRRADLFIRLFPRAITREVPPPKV